MDPGTWFVVVSLIATVAQAYMQQQADKREAAIQEENADNLAREADATRKANALEAEDHKRRAKQLLSTQKVQKAATGASLLSQSFQEVTAESNRNIRFDTEIIKQRGISALNRIQGERNIAKMRAGAIRQGSRWRTGTTLLTGAANAYAGYRNAG